MNKPNVLHKLLTLFKKIDRVLPPLSTQPQAMQRPGLKLFLHGNIVTVETGPLSISKPPPESSDSPQPRIQKPNTKICGHSR